jgi:hypothetical protein
MDRIDSPEVLGFRRIRQCVASLGLKRKPYCLVRAPGYILLEVLRKALTPVSAEPRTGKSMRKTIVGLLLGALSLASGAKAQDAAGPAVGEVAPDFSIPGATRYGLLKNPVRLSDFRGSTVVLAFFYQARTKG